MASIDELEQRLVALERQMDVLRASLLHPVPEQIHAKTWARLPQETDLGQASFEVGWDRAMEKLGIQGQPLGVLRLREMIAACGFKPEDNAFSRGIIDMREE